MHPLLDFVALSETGNLESLLTLVISPRKTTHWSELNLEVPPTQVDILKVVN